jgi:hypothetical protein
MPNQLSKKELSERDICTKFVTPALVRKDKWDSMSQIREEVSFTKGRVIVRGQVSTRGEPKRADYFFPTHLESDWQSSKPRTIAPSRVSDRPHADRVLADVISI